MTWNVSECQTSSLPSCGLPGGVVWMEPSNPLTVWLRESTLCEFRRGVSSPGPHLSDSEVLIPVGKAQRICHVISQLETHALSSCRFARHQWRGLLQVRRACVHPQGLSQACITPDLQENPSRTWQLASISTPLLGLCGHDPVSTVALKFLDTIPTVDSMEGITWLNCHKCGEVHKNSNPPLNDMHLMTVCQASLRCESLGIHEDNRNKCVSHFTRENSVPVVVLKVRPTVYFACAKPAVYSVSADCSPRHWPYSAYASDHHATLNNARCLKNRAESTLILCPWEETLQDDNYNDCLFRTTIDHVQHPTVTLCSKLPPDCVTVPNDPSLRVLPTPPESTFLWHNASEEWGTVSSDLPLDVGVEFDVDLSGDQISQCSHNSTSSSDGSEIEDSDIDDVGTATSYTACQREFSNGNESLSKQTEYWSPSPVRERSLGEAHLPSALSACSEEHNTTCLKKSVSFFEEVTVFIFDKEAPTQDLNTLCSSEDIQSQQSQTLMTVFTSGPAEPFIANDIHSDEDDFEWDDDFCTASPMFPVLMETNQSVWTYISDTPEHPRSSTCFYHDRVDYSTYSITHILESDLE